VIDKSMSIFTKPPSEAEAADLQELVKGRAVENIRLEFKSMVPDKDETLKKLSSFANSFGGFMVIGAKANSDDGRIEDLPRRRGTARIQAEGGAVVLPRG
jgi:predicted HTH transcriptional regulator